MSSEQTEDVAPEPTPVDAAHMPQTVRQRPHGYFVTQTPDGPRVVHGAIEDLEHLEAITHEDAVALSALVRRRQVNTPQEERFEAQAPPAKPAHILDLTPILDALKAHDALLEQLSDRFIKLAEHQAATEHQAAEDLTDLRRQVADMARMTKEHLQQLGGGQ